MVTALNRENTVNEGLDLDDELGSGLASRLFGSDLEDFDVNEKRDFDHYGLNEKHDFDDFGSNEKHDFDDNWLNFGEESKKNSDKQTSLSEKGNPLQSVSCYNDRPGERGDGTESAAYFRVISDDDVGGMSVMDSCLKGSRSAGERYTFGPDDTTLVSEMGLQSIRTSSLSSSLTIPDRSEKGMEGGSLDAVKPLHIMTLGTTKKTGKPSTKISPVLAGMGINHPLNILLVDDNEIVQSTHRRQLETLGYPCELAGNGKEAILTISQKHYDVILLDLQMPEMDGFETAEKIRQMYPPDERPAIIAVTSSTSTDESMRCLLLGIRYYLAKPVSITELSTLLMKCEPMKEKPRTNATSDGRKAITRKFSC